MRCPHRCPFSYREHRKLGMKPAIAEVACMGITPFRTCSFILSQKVL
nr:MAG TPA: hypothetical protein [Caudoviricetes sp.]